VFTAYLMSVNVYGFTVLANRKMCCELYSRRSLRDSGYDDYDAESGFKKRLAFRILTLTPRRITPKTHNQRVFVEIYLPQLYCCVAVLLDQNVFIVWLCGE
jgi:hypothetical protein